MEYVAAVTMLAVLEYFCFMGLTAYARRRSGLQAPATRGDPVFERYYRVQHNSMEQLMVFLPALWIFAHYVHPPSAAFLGLVFVVGRGLYFRGYVEDANKRGTGFAIGFVANLVLTIGALGGAIAAIF